MKYESNTKRARNDLIKEYHAHHPELSLREIGQTFGISKQRISKILKKKNDENIS